MNRRAPRGDIAWQTRVAQPTSRASPALDGRGHLFIGGYSRQVQALECATGRLLWSYPDEGVIATTPAIGADGTVYVSTFSGKLLALDARTGALKWRFADGGNAMVSPTLSPQGVLFTGNDHALYALDARTGRPLWKQEQGAHKGVSNFGSPALWRGVLYATFREFYQDKQPATVRALDARTGRTLWSVPEVGLQHPSVARDGTLYLDGRRAGQYGMMALDGRTGALRGFWPTEHRSIASCPAIGPEGRVYWGGGTDSPYDAQGEVCALDPRTGKRLWRRQFPDAMVDAGPILGGEGTLYVCLSHGIVCALDSRTGKLLWQRRVCTGHLESTPALDADGRLYLGAQNTICALQ